jgi:hypothetical protein
MYQVLTILKSISLKKEYDFLQHDEQIILTWAGSNRHSIHLKFQKITEIFLLLSIDRLSLVLSTLFKEPDKPVYNYRKKFLREDFTKLRTPLEKGVAGQ